MADRKRSVSKAQMEGVAPMNATFDELCALRRDHVYCGDWSIMTDTTVVWLSKQKRGEDQTQHIEIPRHVFNRLLKWYAAEQKFTRVVRRALVEVSRGQK